MDEITQLQDFLVNSIETIFTITVIFLITFITAKLVRKVLDKSFRKSSRLIKTDPTQYNFLKHFISGLIYVLGLGFAVYTIPELRALSVSIFAGAGILAIVIGFASQQAFSNVVGGIFISLFKPFSVGDRIRVGSDIYGVVEDITLRHTVIRTFENKRVIIPNSVISNEVIVNENLGDEKICKFVDFGISYDSDIDKAIEIMEDEAMKHSHLLDNRSKQEKADKEPVVKVKLVGFGDSSVNLRAYVWSPDPASAFKMGCDLNKSIKERFDREGVEIPFPYRTVVYKKDIKKSKKTGG